MPPSLKLEVVIISKYISNLLLGLDFALKHSRALPWSATLARDCLSFVKQAQLCLVLMKLLFFTPTASFDDTASELKKSPQSVSTVSFIDLLTVNLLRKFFLAGLPVAAQNLIFQRIPENDFAVTKVALNAPFFKQKFLLTLPCHDQETSLPCTTFWSDATDSHVFLLPTPLFSKYNSLFYFFSSQLSLHFLGWQPS